MITGWYWVRHGTSWSLAHHNDGTWIYQGKIKGADSFDEIGRIFVMDGAKRQINKRVYA